MGANPRIETVLALSHVQPRFTDCKACAKLTLQTGKGACRDRNACHGVVVRLFDLAETEHGALAGKLDRAGGAGGGAWMLQSARTAGAT